MEKIIIKDITEKPSGLVIVKMNGNRDATLNTKWQSQEVDYLKNDVGVGGSVNVLIQQKGEYTNITKVDLTSAEKNPNYVPNETQGTPVPTSKIMSAKDELIIAQVILKCATEMYCSEASISGSQGEYMANAVNELTGAYKLALSNLKAL